MKYLKIGYVKKTHGIKGEISILPLTDDKERFKDLKKCLIYLNGEYIPQVLKSIKLTPDSVIIKLENYNDRDKSDTLRNKYIFIDREIGVPLNEDEYYTQDLEECSFYYNDELLGRVKSVINEGSCDIFIVDYKNKDVFFPFLKDSIEKIDIDNKKIIIKDFKGYFD